MADELKFTPGPWTIEEYGDEECPALVIHKDSARRVCFMATPGSHGDPAVIEANARLIAAAPDLLDGCEAVVGLIQLVMARDDLPPTLRESLTNNHRVERARAALNKATQA